LATLSLITHVFLPRTEALSLLEAALGVPASGDNLAQAVFHLDHGVILSIEVPKFGEDLPLTLDLTGEDTTALRHSATTLSGTLNSALGWRCELHEWETKGS
jgi:hypothetical protein